MTKISIVVPAHNESRNLPIFHERLLKTLKTAKVDWEWLIIDDHSEDSTFDVLSQLAQKDDRIRVIRLARNHGSFTAISCGFQYATGDCVAVLAADLQDPPEIIPQLLEKWKDGAQIVWACRKKREGETLRTRGLARAYYFFMRRIAGLKNLSPSGADFFLLDRKVLESLNQFKEKNAGLIPLLSWMGFRQENIYYDKQVRLHGQTGWTLRKKIKLFIDSITAFTALPIRLMTYVGSIFALAGFVFAGYCVWEAFYGRPVQGYPSLMVAVMVIGGMQMMMLGVIGEYLWRTYDEARSRPRFIIQQTVNLDSPTPPPTNELIQRPLRRKKVTQ